MKTFNQERNELELIRCSLAETYRGHVAEYGAECLDRIVETQTRDPMSVIHEVTDQSIWLIDQNLAALLPVISDDGEDPEAETVADQAGYILERDVTFALGTIARERGIKTCEGCGRMGGFEFDVAGHMHCPECTAESASDDAEEQELFEQGKLD